MVGQLPIIRPVLVQNLNATKLNSDWVYEFKYDGFRGMLHLNGKEAMFRSKQYKSMPRFDALARKLRQAIKPNQVILDGEIISVDQKTGKPIFSGMLKGPTFYHYVVFDLLFVDGEDVWELPYLERKRRLAELVKKTNQVMLSQHWKGPITAINHFVLANDLEGLVAKRRDDPYNARTVWYKLKNPHYSQKTGRSKIFNSPKT